MIALGIDAAWSAAGPSGVALLAENASGMNCLAAAGSCDEFTGTRSGFDVVAILRAATTLAGRPPDVVAVDMPLAAGPIMGRRVADNAVSRVFGAAGAAVHSPSLMQAGLGAQVRNDFAQAGYRLAVGDSGARLPAMIETYPHPIMMQLCESRRRVPYKASKTLIYWPGADASERRRRLRSVWSRVYQELLARMTVRLPELDFVFSGGFSAIKRHEDALDAIVCALAGIAFARGEAVAYGDAFSAIWLPCGAEDFRRRGIPFESLDIAGAEALG